MLWSGYLQLAAVEPIASAVREGVAFFLCQTGVGRNTLRRTVVLSAAWCVVQVAIAVGMLTSNSAQDAAFWAPFMFWFTTDGSKVLLYFGLLIFWFRPSNERGHLSRNWVYGCAMFVYCMANLIGDLLMYFDVTACVILIAEIVYYCTWPVLTFLALNMDSKYWRNVGRPAWSASSSYTVVQRLSRSRSEFERIVDSDERDRAANHNRLANEHVIDFSRLRILRRIGKKTLNVELLAAFLDGHPVCMKRFHVEDLDARTLDACVREVTIAACLPPHRNIAAMYGVTLLVPTLCVVCEYAARGTLDDFLRQRLREFQVSRLTDPAHATSSSSGPYARINTRHGSLVSINAPPPADGSPPPRPPRAAPPRRSSPATDERRPLLGGTVVGGADSPAPANGTLVVPIDDEQFRSLLTGYEGDDALSLSRLSVGDYGALAAQSSSSEKLADASAPLDDSQFLPLRAKLELARDLACGLAFLHAQKPAIVHSDVSSRNCLLANEAGQMRLMLTDFGTTRRLIAHDMPAPAPRRWSTGSGRYGTEADVCGAGVILHELWTGRVPTSVELAVLQQRASSPAPSGSVPNLPSLLSNEAGAAAPALLAAPSLPPPPPGVGTMPPCWVELMNDCWRVARDRITAAQLEQRVFAMRIDRNESLVVPLQPTSSPPPAPDAVPEPTHVLD